MQKSAVIESVQRNPIQEVAQALGFSSDIRLLIRAAKAARVDRQTRTAHIRTYIETREGPHTYKPFFVIPFEQQVKGLKQKRSDTPSSDDGTWSSPPKAKKARKKSPRLRAASRCH